MELQCEYVTDLTGRTQTIAGILIFLCLVWVLFLQREGCREDKSDIEQQCSCRKKRK